MFDDAKAVIQHRDGSVEFIFDPRAAEKANMRQAFAPAALDAALRRAREWKMGESCFIPILEPA